VFTVARRKNGKKAGRKKLSSEEQTVCNVVSWLPSQRDIAKKIGDGQVSRGVRRLIEFYLDNAGK
jgi:hypothetical protein